MVIGMLANMRMHIDPTVPLTMARRFVQGGAQVCANWTLEGEPAAKRCGVQQLLSESDMVLVFGGDGTILGAARGAATTGTPVFGINYGRLGFLTEAEVGDCRQAADDLLAGRYTVEERMMLRLTMPDGQTYDALNDVTVSRSGEMSLLYLDMEVSGEHFDSYGADGVIVASPTGSTAYSLSCGGPVVSPNLRCMVLCPISPHTLRARPLVIGPQEKVAVSLKDRTGQARVDADGVYIGQLCGGQCVLTACSPYRARFIRLRQRSFYSLLREKLAQID